MAGGGAKLELSDYLAVYVDPRPILGNSHITRSEPVY